MPAISIEFECDTEEEARRRIKAENEDEETINQKVTDNGNYLREVEIPQRVYVVLLDLIEEDDNAVMRNMVM